MAEYLFNPDKNAKLKEERGISFEEIIFLIHEGHLLDVVEHPNRENHPDQRVYVVDVDGYVHLIPFERDDDKIVLKTIYPSRKATRDYLSKRRSTS